MLVNIPHKTCSRPFPHNTVSALRRADLDKLAQVVQLFPQTSKQVLQKALARAEGNLVLAVEILLTRLSSRSTTGSASAVADADGDSTVPARQIGVAAPIGEPPTAVIGDVCERERRGARDGGGRRMLSPGSPSGMTPCPAGQQQQQQQQQRDSPAWRSEGVRGGGGGYRSGGGYSSQATTPRASIDPPLPEEIADGGREEGGENAEAEAEAAEDGDFRGSAASPVVEAGEVVADTCGHAEGDVELGRGGYRAGEAGARAGARAASLAAAVAAAGTSADEEERKSTTTTPVSVSGGMAGAWAARRRSSSFTATTCAELSSSSCVESTILRAPLIGSGQTNDSSAAMRSLGGDSSSGGSQPITGRGIAARAPAAEPATTTTEVDSTDSAIPDGTSSPAVLAAAPSPSRPPAPAPAPAPRPSFFSRLASTSPSPRFLGSGQSAYASFQSSEGSSSSSSSSCAFASDYPFSSGGSWQAQPVAEGGASACEQRPRPPPHAADAVPFRASSPPPAGKGAGLSPAAAADGGSFAVGSVIGTLHSSGGAVGRATPVPAAGTGAGSAGAIREAPVAAVSDMTEADGQKAVGYDRGLSAV